MQFNKRSSALVQFFLTSQAQVDTLAHEKPRVSHHFPIFMHTCVYFVNCNTSPPFVSDSMDQRELEIHLIRNCFVKPKHYASDFSFFACLNFEISALHGRSHGSTCTGCLSSATICKFNRPSILNVFLLLFICLLYQYSYRANF